MGRSDFAIIGAILLGFSLMFCGMIYSGNFLAQQSCSATAEKMAVEHQYSFMTGCLIKTPEGWFPLDQMRRIP